MNTKWYPPAPPTVSFHGKTILVTGANTGLGFEAAKHFLAFDTAHLILAVRSLEKGYAAKERLQEAFPDRKDVIDVLPLCVLFRASTCPCVLSSSGFQLLSRELSLLLRPVAAQVTSLN